MQTDFFISLANSICNDCYISHILDNIPDPIFVKDDEHRFVYVNRALCEMGKMKMEEVVGKTDTELFCPEQAVSYMQKDKEVLEGGCDALSEDDFTDKDGREYRVLIHRRLLKIAGRNYVIGSITDISSKSVLEKELLDLTNRLENSIKEEAAKRIEQERMLIQQSKLAAMGEMLGAIAHQWRQPLAVVGATLSTMQIGYGPDGIDKKMFDEMVCDMEEQIQQMSSTINDFMNFFKPDKQKRQFSLSGAIQNAQKLLGAQLKHRGIELQNQISDKVKVIGYKGQFEQVILNILTNARDAFDGKKQKIRIIRIYLSEYDWKWDIVIEDNAGGIDEGVMDRIFEPYFSTKEEGKGTGLGLYMAKIIMQRSFGGDVVAQNIIDKDGLKGARFIVSIKKEHT